MLTSLTKDDNLEKLVNMLVDEPSSEIEERLKYKYVIMIVILTHHHNDFAIMIVILTHHHNDFVIMIVMLTHCYDDLVSLMVLW